jgi:uncharacterized protein YybS (DUF2232 family)
MIQNLQIGVIMRIIAEQKEQAHLVVQRQITITMIWCNVCHFESSELCTFAFLLLYEAKTNAANHLAASAEETNK